MNVTVKISMNKSHLCANVASWSLASAHVIFVWHAESAMRTQEKEASVNELLISWKFVEHTEQCTHNLLSHRASSTSFLTQLNSSVIFPASPSYTYTKGGKIHYQ